MTDSVVVPEVLADLLVAASLDGGERLFETDRLLRDLAGEVAVAAAHRCWTDRLRRGLVTGTPAPEARESEPAEDVFDLTARLRADTSKHRRRSRP